jgi:AraC-like DNA-binding protein
LDRAALEEKIRHGTPKFPFAAYRNRFAPGGALYAHWHREMELIHIERGSAHFTIHGASVDAARGDVLFVRPGEIHAGHGVARWVAIVFDWRLLAGPADVCQSRYLDPLRDGRLRLPTTVVRARATIGGAVRAILDAERHERPGYELAIKALLTSAVASLFEHGEIETSLEGQDERRARSAERVKKALELVRTRYAERLDLSDLARAAGLSPYYFCRAFKAVVGQSPLQYMNRYRIERASVLLAEPARRVTDVALDTGFGHLSYFIRTFKTLKGCTPAEYQRRLASTP